MQYELHAMIPGGGRLDFKREKGEGGRERSRTFGVSLDFMYTYCVYMLIVLYNIIVFQSIFWFGRRSD